MLLVEKASIVGGWTSAGKAARARSRLVDRACRAAVRSVPSLNWTVPRRSERRISGDITTPLSLVSGGYGIDLAPRLLQPWPAQRDLDARPAGHRAACDVAGEWQPRFAPAPCGGGELAPGGSNARASGDGPPGLRRDAPGLVRPAHRRARSRCRGRRPRPGRSAPWSAACRPSRA